MSDGFVFLAATPAILFYFMNVMITSRKKSTLPFVEENPQAQARAESIRRSMDSNNDLTNSADDNEITNEEDEGLEGIEMGEDAEQNLQMGFASFKLVLSKIGWYTLNLFLVYFLEYSVTVGFADAFSNKLQKYAEDNDDMNENSFFIKNVFTIFAFCYQFGVLISRSSLSLIKIKRVEIVTFLQILNFIFFFLNAQLFFLKNYFVMFGWMIFVGLMGGTSYVNVMYQILNSDKLKKTEKELAVITTCIFDDMGILLASLFSLTLSNTLFKHY
uniref:Battenin n=1 Tax=Euplotes crassus TaxID=5936 RepID=A0A7S3KTF3_EUPCR|mmetsp:Transcript_7606/g.7152  ORF Transcript_7606/g.7152 Transcript_7606/m.7152 type:complete len:273 (+) Transcript_7606:612-1430(+)